MKYVWKDRAFCSGKADAQKVAEEIEQCECRTPKNIVEKAKDKNSAMHNLFEWDDSVAGQKYREEQARYILRSIVVVSEKADEESEQKPIQVRAFVSSGNNDHTYNHISVVVRDDNEYEKLLKQAYEDLQNFKRKYSCLKELEEILALID